MRVWFHPHTSQRMRGLLSQAFAEPSLRSECVLLSSPTVPSISVFWQAVALLEPTYLFNDPLERIQNIRLSQYGYGAKWAKKNLGFQFPGVCKLGLSISVPQNGADRALFGHDLQLYRSVVRSFTHTLSVSMRFGPPCLHIYPSHLQASVLGQLLCRYMLTPIPVLLTRLRYSWLR